MIVFLTLRVREMQKDITRSVMDTMDRPTFRPEQVAPSAFIAESAIVLGDVTLGEQSSVWFQAVLRGDVAPILIGRPRSASEPPARDPPEISYVRLEEAR